MVDRILDEVFGNLAENRPDLDPAQLDRTRKLMVTAVRDCLVTGYEPLIGAVELPDPDDRHVLAAAIKARAEILVTSNLRDFPADSLARWEIEARSPDDLVLDLIGVDAKVVWGCVQRLADAWRRPPGTAVDVLHRLARDGLTRSVADLSRGEVVTWG